MAVYEKKITRLTPSNVDALRLTMPDYVEQGALVLGSTTAEFRTTVEPAELVQSVKDALSDRRGHPGGSLSAVIRKLRA